MSPQPPLSPAAAALILDLNTLETPLDWQALFGRPGPNAIEIGTGNGIFLANEAARLPEWNFIGIEREPEFYYKMVRRCARGGLTNVRTTSTDAIEVLDHWIAPGSVQRLYCYFSDPWPKRRHAERRVFGAAMPARLERLLAPDGEVWFKTDVDYYFNLAITVFRRRGGWQFFDIGRRGLPDAGQGEVVTNFERKAREAGSQVWGFKARLA